MWLRINKKAKKLPTVTFMQAIRDRLLHAASSVAESDDVTGIMAVLP